MILKSKQNSDTFLIIPIKFDILILRGSEKNLEKTQLLDEFVL